MPPPAEGLLPSRPFGPTLPATRYNIYAAEAAAAEGALGVVIRPAPLNPTPLPTTVVSTPGIVFGQERCFVVRSLTELGGAPIEGPPSAPSCVTPIDTFPPPPPTALEAVGGAGVISLIWEASEVPDLAGYFVLRGEAPGDPGDAADAGADSRHQLRGPLGDAGRALRLRGRRGRLGHARQSQRAVESSGRDRQTIDQRLAARG